MEKPVTVKMYNTRLEAGVDKSYLQSQDIESYIEADDTGGVEQYPFQPNVSGVLLKVSAKDYDSAKKLLGRIKQK